MRRNQFLKAALMAVWLAAGCKTSGTGGSDSTAGSAASMAAAGPPVTKVSVCERCEDPAEFYQKVTLPNQLPNLGLTAGETKSLGDALPPAASAKGTVPLLHAEAVNGELVFRADDDPAHAGKTQLGMMVERRGGTAQPVRVVATPEAAVLLHKRAG